MLRAVADVATSRSVAARRWRKEPSNRLCLRAGSSRVPREGQARPQRTDIAPRDAREADDGAEVHQRLCCRAREGMVGPPLDAVDVDVAREDVLAEGEVADGGGGVRPDAGESRQVIWPAALAR